MVRKRIKRSLEWIHLFLIFSVLAPLIYMGDFRRDPDQMYRIYYTGYLLLLPIAVTMNASRRCKRLLNYLFIVAGIFLAVSFGAKQLGALYLTEVPEMIYVGSMKIFILVIAFLAFAMRIYMARRLEAKETGDASWREAEIRFDKPNKMVCLWFVVVYVCAQNMACPQLCNVALFSTLAYLIVAVAHEYLDKTQDYIKHNEEACRVRNIPYRRIYGIGKYFLLGYLCLLLLTMIPAILTIGRREYRDIRTNHFAVTETVEQTENTWKHLVLPEPEVEEPRNKMLIKVLDTLLYSISAITMFILMLVVINLIRREIAKFAQSVQEDDDIVETLKLTDDEEKIQPRIKSKKRTEENKIRRQYRKFIRKHRKDRPAAYETPIEIETAAGVADTTEGKTLHEQYELARYGNLEKI